MTNRLLVVYVETNSVQPSGWNPPNRTKDRNLKTLEAEIIKAGEILVPLALTKNGELADGHRRLAIAKKLNYPSIPVIFYEETNPQKLWSQLNTGMRAIRGTDWTQALSLGLSIEYLPDHLRDSMVELQRVLGPEDFDRLVKQGRAPAILRSALSIASYCGNQTDEFIRAAVVWLMDYKQNIPILRAMTAKTDPAIITNVILTQRALVQEWK